MRQAAGPLTENLPNVCLVNDLEVLTGSVRCNATNASRKESLHQGTMSRLSSGVVCLNAQHRKESELAKGSPCASNIGQRESQRGHLAKTPQSGNHRTQLVMRTHRGDVKLRGLEAHRR